MTEAPYTVEVDGDLIIIDSFQRHSAESVQAIRSQVEGILAQKHGPRDILVRHHGAIKTPDESATAATMRSLREVAFRRLAVVTTTPKHIGLTHSMFQAIGADDRLKIFRDETLAREWLKAANHPLRTKLKKHTPSKKEK